MEPKTVEVGRWLRKETGVFQKAAQLLGGAQ